MADWPIIVVRLALYGSLGLVFGLPFFAASISHEPTTRLIPRAAALLAVVAIPLSLLGFALQIATMGGTSLTGIAPAIASAVLLQTAVGWALLVRIAALAFALAVALAMPAGKAKLWLLMLVGGIALATLAWAGHGAATPGAAGTAHLIADIAHLLAAAAWLGALVLLLILVSPHAPASPAHIESTRAALAGFATLGTILVGLIIATGLVNGAYLVGIGQITALGDTAYGRLLILKLLAFLAMLACAAANRFRLTPRLAASIATGDSPRTLALLRRSVAIETTLALLILGLVAWLGTLEPPVSGL